jgi:hypothetical protein
MRPNAQCKRIAGRGQQRPSHAKTKLTLVVQHRYTVLCFPPAGCAEDMFTSEGTGARKAPSPLLVSGSLTRQQIVGW